MGMFQGIAVGSVGDETGVDEAIVPPTPVRDVAGILSGALRVMEHAVGTIAIGGGVIRAGLCGEPMPITKGVLEVEAALSLRSGGAGTVAGVPGLICPCEPARDLSVVTAGREDWLTVYV